MKNTTLKFSLLSGITVTETNFLRADFFFFLTLGLSFCSPRACWQLLLPSPPPRDFPTQGALSPLVSLVLLLPPRLTACRSLGSVLGLGSTCCFCLKTGKQESLRGKKKWSAGKQHDQTSLSTPISPPASSLPVPTLFWGLTIPEESVLQPPWGFQEGFPHRKARVSLSCCSTPIPIS